MKVLVLGAGVVGVTTAYYLARQGHEVKVVDRQPSVAMETSYGNAGQVSFGFSSPFCRDSSSTAAHPTGIGRVGSLQRPECYFIIIAPRMSAD